MPGLRLHRLTETTAIKDPAEILHIKDTVLYTHMLGYQYYRQVTYSKSLVRQMVVRSVIAVIEISSRSVILI